MYKIDLFRSVLYQKIPTHENIKMPVETRFIASENRHVCHIRSFRRDKSRLYDMCRIR